MLIRSVMISNPVTCGVDDDLAQAVGHMAEHNIGFLPVVDRDRRVIGVLTDRDALLAAHRRDLPLRALRVEDAMSREPRTCTIHDDVVDIEHRMAAHGIRRLPVVDEAGTPIGVVALADIARASMRSYEVSSRSPTWVLAAVSRPSDDP